MRATLVVPTLNEASSIGHVLETFRAAAAEANPRLFPNDPLDWEVLVVDGASTDGTADAARAAGARVIPEPRPGYGRAYRTGFAEASGEVIATADGDATYPVEEIPRLVRKILDEGIDFLTCDRLKLLDAKAMTREHRVGNWALNFVLKIAYHRYLKPAGGTLSDRDVGLPSLGPRAGPRDPGRDGVQRGAEARGAPERVPVRGGPDPLRRAVGGAEALELAGRAAQPRVPGPQAARDGARPAGAPDVVGRAPAYWVFPDRSRDFGRSPW
jgi:hypothetical protein